MIRRQAMLAVIGVTALLMAGCDPFPEKYSYRYRLTVEVDTPQGLRSGSSVIEQRAQEGTGVPDTAIRSSTKGEAVAIDLPGGRTVFALLRTVDYNSAPFASAAFAEELAAAVPQGGDLKTHMNTIAAQKRLGVLPSKYFPMLVWFSDIRDPKTVKAVKPDDFEETFGSGTRLRRVTVQITDDPVIQEISARFPWWKEYLNKNFDGSSSASQPVSTENIAEQLTSLSFGIGD
jgi:hypothetical protein